MASGADYFKELAKFGPDVRALLYVQLASCWRNYLVILVTEEFRFALVSLGDIPDNPTFGLMIEDIEWLDVQRIHGDDVLVRARGNAAGVQASRRRGSLGGYGRFDLKSGTDWYENKIVVVTSGLPPNRFKLETEILRELYSYCW